MPVDDLKLMHLHVQTVFRKDEYSCLIRVNDWAGGVVPRFFLGRTCKVTAGPFWQDLPGHICDEIFALSATEPATISGAPVHSEKYQSLLTLHDTVESVWNRPDYFFLAISPSDIPTVRMTPKNASRFENGLIDWVQYVPRQQPMVKIVDDDQAVAICASLRITGAAHGAEVEMQSVDRKRGYGSALVSARAKAVQKAGALTMYSTSDTNLAFQKVVSRLGLRQYGADFYIT